MRRLHRSALLSATVAVCALVLAAAPPAAGAPGHGTDGGTDPAEAAVIGVGHARAHAELRRAAKGAVEYPQSRRNASLASLAASQREANSGFQAAVSGRFAEYFPSPDFGVHVAQLPTGKVLLFSFSRVETDPTKRPGPRTGSDPRTRAAPTSGIRRRGPARERSRRSPRPSC
ncbi:hypothetical protein ACE1OC_39070 [Streptomyces sp. DSM 116496]|uniref:hypothetical protein n=1 Tax=Streptomyces stoeckheimensis TaxID=3344656 RepID=UPI0038B3458A